MRQFRVPERVGLVEGSGDDEAVYLAGLPDGPIVVLRDTALTIWQEAVSPTGEGGLAQRVADLYGVAVSEVSAAVEACVTDLLGRRLLEPVSESVSER